MLRVVPSVIEGAPKATDEYDQVAELADISGLPVPQSLAALKDKPVRFKKVIAKEDMEQFVLGELGITD